MTTPSRRAILGSSIRCSAALLGAAAASTYSRAAQTSLPVAETTLGKVRGKQVNGVTVFSAIPYAGATEGAARFLAPGKPVEWAGTRDATGVPPRCVQAPGSVFGMAIGEYFAGGRKDKLRLDEQKDSENCLYLNVLTPALGAAKKLPVMVYIHGGGYTSGSGIIALGADALSREQEVVLVSVNHRLNAFGYLYLGELDARFADSGNAGMLDLIAALEWVRDNIEGFGGNAKNVTIFGESGGGAKISTLMAMPAAQGLFHKVIIESGSSLRVSTKEQGTETARIILRKLGIPDNQVGQLQKVDSAKLLAASLHNPQESGGSAMRFGPVVDGRSIPRQTWEPDAPGVSAKIPMIIGSCKDEATLFMGGKDQENFKLDEAGLRTQVGKMLNLPDADLDALIATYHKDLPSASPSDIYFAIGSDRMFRTNSIAQAERKVDQAEAPVYMYLFTYDTPAAAGKYKAFHTAELPLVLRLVKYPESEPLSKQLSGAWAAFARGGDPNFSGLPEWPRYTRDRRGTMIFNTDTKVENDPRGQERIAMQHLFPNGSPM